MLAEPKLKILLDLVRSSTNEELIWMNGYLSWFVSNDVKKEKIEQEKAAVSKITIAYGTETGNSKRVAIDLAVRAKKMAFMQSLWVLINIAPMIFQKKNIFLQSSAPREKGNLPLQRKNSMIIFIKTALGLIT